MDEPDDGLEGRLMLLVDGIDVPAAPAPETIAAGRSHRATRRLTLVAGIAVALLVGVGVVLTRGSSTDEPPVAVDTGPATTTPATTTPTVDPSAELADLLAGLGVDLAAAPPGVADAAGATLCGLVERGLADEDTDAESRSARCFIDAHLARVPAVLVETYGTVEGDPIVVLHRSRSDGTYDQLVDSTRDAFGSGTWGYNECDRLTTSFPDAPEALPPQQFMGAEPCRYDELLVDVPALVTGSVAPMPSWFADRAALPLCGVAVRIEDVDLDQRQCFADAVAVGDPAEFAYVSFGDEGEAAARWYRSLGDGTFEMITHWLPDDADSGPAGDWIREACVGIEIAHEPGSEVDLLPVAGVDCTPVAE